MEGFRRVGVEDQIKSLTLGCLPLGLKSLAPMNLLGKAGDRFCGVALGDSF